MGPLGGEASILFDTDVLIDAGRGVEEAVRTIHEAENRSVPAISSVTQMELIVGCRNKTELQALDDFLGRFLVLPLDELISSRAIELLRRFRLSHGLLIADALIGATALVSEIPLISKNQRDYRFVPDLELVPYPQPFGR